MTWDTTKLSCIICGNGKLEKNETCDDGGLGKCLPDCSGPIANAICSGGSSSTPSICTCSPGFVGVSCTTLCGDGLVVGNEICDDGGLGGCLPDCSGATQNYTCSAGSPTTASVCSCSIGFSLQSGNCLPTCGDGLVFPPETCDDNNNGGCLPDCSGVFEDFFCYGGS